jgi:alpha-amylase
MAETNGVMMQYFHWYNSEDGSLWKQLADSAADLAKVGVTSHIFGGKTAQLQT